MSTAVAEARVPIPAPLPAPAIAPRASFVRAQPTRLAAFAGLALLAASRYAGIEARTPGGRVVGIVAVAIIAAAALILIRMPHAARRRTRALVAAARVVALAGLLAVALLIAGVPAHLLDPARWGTLESNVRGGIETLSWALWPYLGSSTWARLDILSALPAVLIAAAALAFWPAPSGRRAAALTNGARQLGAITLLLALYVIGVLDGRRSSATLDGVLLFALLAAWLWPPRLPRRRAAWAIAWLATGGALAAVITGPIGGGRAWLNYRSWDLLSSAGSRAGFSWDQTYGPIAWPRSHRVMFTVKGAGPQLWKTTTLDRFDGLRFVRSGVDMWSVVDLPTPVQDRWYTFASFSIEGLGADLLPTEQGTTMGVYFNRATRRASDGATRVVGPALRKGDAYTVLAYVPRPGSAQLRAAPRTFPEQYLRYTAFDLPSANQSGLDLAATDPQTPGRFFGDRTVSAPAPGLTVAGAPGAVARILASPYGQVYRLARRLADGARSTFDVASAIQGYLKASYTYGEQPPPRRYPLASFLFDDRVGYCQQFSGAMALMLRMDGVPARVAAGFLPGRYDPRTKRSQVRAIDAHSWVEVYFGGIGWVPFDPTPPATSPTTKTVAPFASASSAALAAGLIAPGRRAPATGRNAVRGATAAADGPPSWAISAGLAGGLALLVLASWLIGYLRLRRSLAGDAELASRELERALRRLGYAIPTTVTLAKIEQRVRHHGGPEAARYVRLLRERRYASAGDVTATLRDRRRLRRGLTRHLGVDARLRGLWVLPPASLGWSIGARGRHAGAP